MPLVASRDTPGMMARTVEDIILMNSVLSTCNTSIPAVNLTGLRVGYATNWWAQVADEVGQGWTLGVALGPWGIGSRQVLGMVGEVKSNKENPIILALPGVTEAKSHGD